MKNLLQKIKCIFGRHNWEKSVTNVYLLATDPPTKNLFFANVKYECKNCGETVIKEKERIYE